MAETNPQTSPASAITTTNEELNRLLATDVAKINKDLIDATKPNPDTLTKVEQAVVDFCRQVVQPAHVISNNALESLTGWIKALDDKLSQQIDLALHHPEFQKLEGTWRGLEHLVYGTETGPDLKIRVLNLRKGEMAEMFKNFKGNAWDTSPLFKKIYGPYDAPGAHPFSCLVGDYHFNHSAPDVDVMAGIAQIAAAAHAPFIAGADPSMLDLESWERLSDPRDVSKIFERPEWVNWRDLRKTDDSRYLSLTLPRFLSRQPYGPDNPVTGWEGFRETVEGGDHTRYTWSNSAYAMAANINQAFKVFGWCSCINGKTSGGEVSGLHCHTFPTDDGGVDTKCPTEISIGDRREHDLSKLGFTALRHWQHTATAAFDCAVSVYEPKIYGDPDATANSKLNKDLPHLFAMCRFAHFIKAMVRDAIGRFAERKNMEDWLNKWITNYVVTDANASQEVKAEYPLAAAEVEVKEVPGNPGYYDAVFYLRPHYQLKGLKASLRLVSKLPSVKKTA